MQGRINLSEDLVALFSRLRFFALLAIPEHATQTKHALNPALHQCQD